MTGYNGRPSHHPSRYALRTVPPPRYAGRDEEEPMSKQTPNKFTKERYAARFHAEKAALQRHYCTVFKFWRMCAFKRCRKARSCSGNAQLCLRRRVQEIAREAQWQARQHILASTPAAAGPPERTAREYLPAALAAL